MAPLKTHEVSPEQAGQRLDIFLTHSFPDKTRSYFSKLIRQDHILVNNQRVKSGYIVQSGDRISLHFPEDQIDLQPAAIPLNIVYEDDDILVINKSAGMVVHPARGTGADTLVNAILHHNASIARAGTLDRPGIVHRLDKNTSGLIVVAKHNQAHVHLRNQFSTRSIERTYWALVWGQLEKPAGTVSARINRSKKEPTKMTVALQGREAITHYEVLQNFEYMSLLQIKLDTGRTHQIRVHMKHIHHPVVGDPEYNGRDSQLNQLPFNLRKRGKHLLDLLPHQALHAKKLTFIHPRSNKPVEFQSELPQSFAEAIEKLPRLFMLDD